MATLRTYSATFEQDALASSAVARWRFNETSDATAIDSADDLDGTYLGGFALNQAGVIGDGAASFDGSGIVLVETLSGTVGVATLGDSLADPQGGFQPAGQTFADDLPAALQARGLTVQYFDHAVSGDRTSDGLARVDDVINDSPQVVILELGTNDAGGSVPLGTVESNLNQIIDALQAAGIDDILLTSTFGAFPGRGSGYATEQERAGFEALFPAIAQTQGVELLNIDGSDKFLGGERIPGATPAEDTIVGGVLDSNDPSLQIGDGLHPDADGIDFIVPRVVPQTIALGAAAGVVNEPLLLSNGSFELWFTADSVAGDHTLLAKNSQGQGTGGQFALFISDGRAGFALGDGQHDFAAQSAGAVVAAGEPTHLVATFGAGGMHVFVDGAEVATNAYTGGLDAGLGNFEQLVIGAESGASTPGTTDDLRLFFSGTIDEVAIYDRTLTAGEVQQLFDGGEAGSTLVGTAAADELIGGSDDEDLRGGGGDDDLRGNSGNDTILGQAGNDTMFGGAGNDDIRGGAGKDKGYGGADADVLFGNGGADVLAGGAGDDQLFGGPHVDNLRGGPGDDLLNGGGGRDTLVGGDGQNTYQIDSINDGVDRVVGFKPGATGDILDLNGVLDFDGGDPVANFVHLNEVNGNTQVAVNADGAGTDFTPVFNLVGLTGLNIDTLVNDGNVQLTPPPTS